MRRQRKERVEGVVGERIGRTPCIPLRTRTDDKVRVAGGVRDAPSYGSVEVSVIDCLVIAVGTARNAQITICDRGARRRDRCDLENVIYPDYGIAIQSHSDGWTWLTCNSGPHPVGSRAARWNRYVRPHHCPLHIDSRTWMDMIYKRMGRCCTHVNTLP